MVSLSAILLLFLLFFISESSVGEEAEVEIDEEFSEALLLRPLPDRKVLAHFHFQSKVPPTHLYGHHHHLFPKSIYQLVHKFHIREMELSFTQGRWNYEHWGGYDPIASCNVKPPGVELWAVFDVPQQEVDASWKNLTHALSGLFCASINFLEHSTAYSAPRWSLKSSVGKLRYGTLPREAVCTENLTPWLKLLPCRDKAGIAGLMDRPSIYRGYYHSQRLHLISTEFDSAASSFGIVLDQTLTVVLQPNNMATGPMFANGTIMQPDWSLSSLFGRTVNGKCVISRSSNVYVQFEQNMISELIKFRKGDEESHCDTQVCIGPALEMSDNPDRIIKETGSLHTESLFTLYEFSVENYSDLEPFDLGIRWKLPLMWSCRQAPLSISRYLMGSGNERGSIAISLTGRSGHKRNPGKSEEGCWTRLDIFQVVPWYVKVYYHTLKVFIDEEPKSLLDNIEKIHVMPSEDKVSPGVMELRLRLPCDVKSAGLTIDFDKGLLHIDEYPPDANQGFDIPSAIVVFADFQTHAHINEAYSLNRPPLLSKLQERNPVLSYTEILLVPLTTPDFSMPYNVITITCTVFALYFGSLLNALRRRVSEEERLLKSRVSKRNGPLTVLLSKLSAKFRGNPSEPPKPPSHPASQLNYKLLVKVILVAGLAVAWHYFLS